jgi:hypothetical protein
MIQGSALSETSIGSSQRHRLEKSFRARSVNNLLAPEKPPGKVNPVQPVPDK